MTEATYQAAVEEGKEIVASGIGRLPPGVSIQKSIEDANKRLHLGNLADKVTGVYGEDRLGRYAREIGLKKCVLERCRSVARAFPNMAPAPVSFSVLQELQAVPEREQIIAENPSITRSEARSLRQEWRAAEDPHPESPDDEQVRAELNGGAGYNLVSRTDGTFDVVGNGINATVSTHEEGEALIAGLIEASAATPTESLRQTATTVRARARSGVTRILKIANDAIRATNVDRNPELLRSTTERKLVPQIREGGQALIDFADYLEGLLNVE